MDNGRRRLELLHSLLFSLPGTPVMYYGDEINMGDNIFLGDRHGVRTPMQWTPDRNAGFSRADYARLYAPVIADTVYGYQALNVEAQETSPYSFLNWIREVVRVRKQHAAFGMGNLRFVNPPNRRVMAFVRAAPQETLLCVYNLARGAQPAELDLAEWVGHTPIELFADTPFPPIADRPYQLSLGPYGVYWFRLQPPTPGGGG
jgi:maltose alpha-D-glucosyltransferase/alpha-amylase